jgi:chemotaxis protein methyltransferase CheR
MEALKSFDIGISDEVFTLFAELIYKASGIKLTSVKKGLLVSRLLKRLKKLDITGFHNYYRRVANDNEEMVEMLNCISTNTTMFFREEYHFEYLKNIVLPGVMKNNKDKTIRIWSAGCSTGEEAYSIAITVQEALRQCQGTGSQGSRLYACATPCPQPVANQSELDIIVLATDISTRALDTAQAGIYEEEQISDSLQPDLIKRYFLRGVNEHTGKIKVKDFVKQAIRFRRLNLKDMTYPFQNKFDIIFCRNVMIYFDGGMKGHVLSHFQRHLREKGHLFLGHAETMLGEEVFKPVFITVYQKL